MPRLGLRGKRDKYALAGGYVAPRIHTINQPGIGNYDNPRQLFVPLNARPGVRYPTIVWKNGSPNYKGTNAEPSVMNNTGHIADNFPFSDVIPNATTFGYNVFCQQYPGGVSGEWPGRYIGLQAFDALFTADALQYRFELDRTTGIAFSGGVSALWGEAYSYPSRYAALICLDTYLHYTHLADNGGHENDTPSSSLAPATVATVYNQATACAEWVRKCGHIPIIVVTSSEALGAPYNLGPRYDELFTAYTNAGKTVTTYNPTWPTHPTIDPTRTCIRINYASSTHGNIGSGVPALSNTSIWNWIAARRRGEPA